MDLIIRNIIRMSNSLIPDQAQPFVGTDLCPNCFQRLSANDIKLHTVKSGWSIAYTEGSQVIIKKKRVFL